MSESAAFPHPGASRRRFLAGTGVLGGAAALAACGGATGGGGGGGGEELVGVGNGGQAGSGRAGDGADQLFIAGFQWSPPTNFNTFAGAPAWPASANVAQYIYETLLRFHIVTGELLPGLAASEEWIDVAALGGARGVRGGLEVLASCVHVNS